MKKNVTHSTVLALETSGRLGSVALGTTEAFIEQKTLSGPLKHSQEVLPAAQELLQKHNVEPSEVAQVYLSIGPGSFTGLRIAVTIAKTLALAQKTKIVAVDTLDAIAANAVTSIENADSVASHVGCILDAKRGQFFVAGYAIENGNARKILDDRMLKPQEFIDQFIARHEKVYLLGEGLVYYRDRFTADNVVFLDEDIWVPQAAIVYQLGREKAQKNLFEDPFKLTPFYLRRAAPEEKH